MSSWLQHFGRRAGLGRLAYKLWHEPRAALARSRREGGPLEQWRDARGRDAMVAAAAHLPPTPPADPTSTPVCFLTGRRFWYQTAFCCWTLQRHAGRALQPVFIDDGTFDADLRRECQRLFPGCVIQGADDIDRHLDQRLPAARYPALRGQRRSYIHLRKLTDAHAGLAGWRVVLDSDMLFFRRPDFLLDWMAQPDRPIHMLDVQDSYGYPRATLEELAGGPVPSQLNVGICGLRSDAIDWELLEHWCAELLRRHGTSYYLEQALVALWMSRGPERCVLPAADYALMPGEAECRSPTAAMHHYVDLSKRGYFRHAWRNVFPS
jgi:hypothetical protein